MKLKDLRTNLFEDDGGGGAMTSSGDAGGAVDATMTSTDDIATYAWPLFWGFGKKSHARRSNSGLASVGGGYKKNKKRKNEAYNEEDDGSFVRDMLDYAASRYEDKLGPYSFDVGVDGDNKIRITSPTGRDFSVVIFKGYLVVTLDGAKLKIDQDAGIVCNKEIFMVRPVPGGEASFNDGTPVSYDVAVDKLVTDSWYYVLKYDMFMTIAPFVDVSVNHPLEEDDLERMRNMFFVIDAKDWKGTFNHMHVYKDMFGGKSKDNDEEKEEPKGYDNVKKISFFRPMNIFKNKTDFNPIEDMANRFLKIEWSGLKPKKKFFSEIWWGEDLRVRLSPNGVGIIESNLPNVDGKRTWCAVHGVPWLPSFFIDEYMNEAEAFIKSYKAPRSYRELSIDWADMVHRIWTSNAGELPYMGGVCYYKDGVWGIDYYCSGYGRGASDNGAMDLPIISYQFKQESDGTLGASSYVTYKVGATYDIGQRDINVRFHPSLPLENVVRFMRRFTYFS